jgi:hypothetical protein
MKPHESFESIRDIAVDAYIAGKVIVASLIKRPMDWIDQQLCNRNDLGSED